MAYVLPTLVAMGFGSAMCELALPRPLLGSLCAAGAGGGGLRLCDLRAGATASPRGHALGLGGLLARDRRHADGFCARRRPARDGPVHGLPAAPRQRRLLPSQSACCG